MDYFLSPEPTIFSVKVIGSTEIRTQKVSSAPIHNCRNYVFMICHADQRSGRHKVGADAGIGLQCQV